MMNQPPLKDDYEAKPLSSSSISTNAQYLNPCDRLNPVIIISSLASYLQSGLLVLELLFLIIFCYIGLNSTNLIYGGNSINERPIPYQVTKSGDVILDFLLSAPAKFDVTFPSYLLKGVSIWLPLMTIIVFGHVFQQRNTQSYDVHSGVCGLLFGIGLNEFTTQCLKLYIGRLRPNFYSLCEFDTSLLKCTAPEVHILEARMSFPSGHSSLSFSGLFFLTLYFLGRSSNLHTPTATCKNSLLGCFKRRIFITISISPMVLCTFVAASRLVDNWHHPADIVAGSCIGLFCAFISYHMWYPFILSVHAGKPLYNLREDEK